jgi:hypothetical protein
MRQNIGTVTAAPKSAPRAATPELPRLTALAEPVETVSLKAATNRLGVGHNVRALAKLGLQPVSEAAQGTPQGLLHFRAYSKAEVEAVYQRLHPAPAQAVQAAAEPSAVIPGPAAKAQESSPSRDEEILRRQSQTFAVLCEIRDLLKAAQAVG